jgi:hypothetical protein
VGEWEEIVAPVWETVVRPCQCCGQVVAKRLWKADVEGSELSFCSPECEQLYREYVVGRRS